MKYFIDTEFIDDGKIIDLISIGIVAEDGRELYLQSVEFTWNNASPWVWDNVYPHLVFCPHVDTHDDSSLFGQMFEHPKGQCLFPEPSRGIIGGHTDCPWRTREQMQNEVKAFLDPAQYGTPQFYGWITGYDYVALCQIFGTMMDMPRGYPHHIKDLQQILDEYRIPDDQLPLQEKGLHHALEDARHIQKLWTYVARSTGKDI